MCAVAGPNATPGPAEAAEVPLVVWRRFRDPGARAAYARGKATALPRGAWPRALLRRPFRRLARGRVTAVIRARRRDARRQRAHPRWRSSSPSSSRAQAPCPPRQRAAPPTSKTRGERSRVSLRPRARAVHLRPPFGAPLGGTLTASFSEHSKCSPPSGRSRNSLGGAPQYSWLRECHEAWRACSPARVLKFVERSWISGRT